MSSLPMRCTVLVALLLLSVWSGRGRAETVREVRESRPMARVHVVNSDGLRLDGRLDEPAWRQAEPIGPLVMVEPDEGVPASEPTEVRVLATSDALYIGVVCHDSRPEAMVRYSLQRDADMSAEDHIRVVLDTFLDGRSGYVFAVNPNGARYDALVSREGEDENADWDGIWEAAARVTDRGWSAELRIPIKTLRFAAGKTTWGFNVERRIQRLLETDRWASPIRNFKVTHVARAGYLTGLPAFQQGLGLTIRPYTLASSSREQIGAPTARRLETGLDVLKNLGSNVTALLSINTDFAETEVDTRQINLTRFPLFFPEKRTFFLEGADIFDFGLGLRVGPDWDLIPFFSRRIGLLAGRPIPLRLATKITGRLGNTNFGILDVLTSAEPGLAPATNLFVARAYQNILDESKIGFLITAGDPQGRPGRWLVGFDFTYKTTRFQGNKNFLIGVWGLHARQPGARGRPYAWGFKIDYPNDLWDSAFIYKQIGDAFDPSLGFVPWRGIHKFNMGLQYKPRPDWPWMRQMFHQVFAGLVLDLHGRVMQSRLFLAPINWRLESGDRIEINAVPMWERIPEAFAITPQAIVQPGRYRYMRYRVEVETADKRPWKFKGTWWFGTFYDGHLNQVQLELSWRPSPHFNLSVAGERNRGRVHQAPFDIQLARTRLGLFLTPDIQLISFIQYDNLSNSIGMNTRFRYTWRSLLDIFVVFNRNWVETEGTLRTQLNQVFVKVQYAWRP